MENKNETISVYIATSNPNVRYKVVEDFDPIFGGMTDDFQFEILKRPYFFGLIGYKKWEISIITNCYTTGLSFSEYLLK